MNQKDIISRYPQLFARYYLPMTQTCMCWGIQTGKGWFPIIDDLCGKIQKLIDEKLIQTIEFECIKEKYGSLRIITYKYCKEVDVLIKLAVCKASVTCEECSKHIIYNQDSTSDDSNEKMDNYYYNKLCDDCKQI